uniref:helix-turn-helix transcriptional regulator n=1 Tax=Pedobacter schmidteae TaxID=2201271 RepID=UPI000EAC62C9|nr:helix-turn-helix transcriptional regulator [Pedobacter schmidteae]
MQSHIKLQVTAEQSAVPTTNFQRSPNSIVLKTADIEEFHVREGRIAVQSISHYLAHIELFDYNLDQEKRIEFMVTEAAFFMYADRSSSTCQLCYRPAGKYEKTLPAGSGQLLLITFRSDWLVYRCGQLPDLMPFTGAVGNPEHKKMSLSPTGIADSLFSALKKMDMTRNRHHADHDGYIFINGCIQKYYNNLKRRDATAHYQHHKATAIATFVRTHFASPDVDNLPKLAARFMVSERSLARLAKMAFGIPLHEEVIRLRIDYASKQLYHTDKPIYEIARLSGYKEPHYFSKAFKKFMGYCPKAMERPLKKVAVFA